MADDGWDLQAVVRGCYGAAAAVAAAPDPFCAFSPLGTPEEEWWWEQSDLRFCFPELSGPQAETQELDELWKAFVADSPRQQTHLQQQQPLLSTQGSCSSSGSAAAQVPAAVPAAALPQPLAPQPPQRTPPHSHRPKRRKNQQKRVICQVPADGLSADMWAWRKYGQKPIKGSPYPRGYYRCSSSKGCLARKQVERSRADPGMFVVTYTGEHNHPQPTHRNSLAGSTRQKFPSSSSPATSPAAAAAAALVSPEHPDCCKASPCSPLSSPSAAGLSPATTLTDSMEEEPHLPPGTEGQGAEEEVEEGGLLLVGDMEVLGEDDVLFLGFEELGKPDGAAFADAFADHFGAFPSPWTANNTAAAAAGGS